MVKKGQTSLEQLLMTAIGLTFIGIILFFAMNFANDSIRVSQAQDVVDTLAKSADYVDSLGPMSQDKVDIYVPEGFQVINVEGNRIHMQISLSSGNADVYAHTHASLLGGIPTVSGPQEVTISSTPDGRVRFGNAALLCLPYSITRTFTRGYVGSDSFTVTNVGDFEITEINAVLSGNVADVLTLVQPGVSLDVGESGTIGMEFDIPVGKEEGIYSGWITVVGSNQTECATGITITLFVIPFGGPDDGGPVVTSIGHVPDAPDQDAFITINATGDDSLTGNSTVEICQLELDYSGIWNDMEAVDGAYDESIEEVTYGVGRLGGGTHSVRIRCMDSKLNVGDSGMDEFSVILGGLP